MSLEIQQASAEAVAKEFMNLFPHLHVVSVDYPYIEYVSKSNNVTHSKSIKRLVAEIKYILECEGFTF